MKNIFKKAAGIITMATLLVGCGNSANTENNKVEDVKNIEEVVLEHSKGEAKVSKNPKKIAVLDLGVLDIINELGVDAEIILPTKNLPKNLVKYENSENAGSIVDPDMEAIYEFKPDVIFISGRQQKLYDEFSKIAPTVYVQVEPETYMEDVKRNVDYIAELFDKEDIAKEKYDELLNKVNKAKEIAEKSDDKALVVLTNDGSISAYGKNSRFGIIHDVLGVKAADENIEVATHGQEASYEYISKIDPDILFVVDRTAVVGGTEEASKTMENDLIATTKAAKNNKVIYLNPENWYLVSGGLNSVSEMVDEVINAIK